jgi:hypothetical protein
MARCGQEGCAASEVAIEPIAVAGADEGASVVHDHQHRFAGPFGTWNDVDGDAAEGGWSG